MNESSLEKLGKVNLWLELGKSKKVVEFYIAKEISPDMIGAITLLKKFDIAFKMLETESKPVKMRINSVNSGNNTIGQSCKNDLINEMVKEFQDIFMKHKWDIGKTNIVKHEIQTNSKPIVINPRRQPYHLMENIVSILIHNYHSWKLQ